MPRGGLKAVFFDAGGTLISPHPSLPEIYETVLGRLGVKVRSSELHRSAMETWAEFDAIVGRGRDRYSYFEGGEHEYWTRYVYRVLERVDQAHRASEAARALHEAFSDPSAWRVFPESRATLRALREKGLRLGVISNWDSRLRGLLESLDLAREFETIVVSCEVGAEKPSRAIFQRALDELRVEAHEAMHVGDDPVGDYEGSISAGLGATLLVRQKTPTAWKWAAETRSAPEGVRSIAGLDEMILQLSEGAQG